MSLLPVVPGGSHLLQDTRRSPPPRIQPHHRLPGPRTLLLDVDPSPELEVYRALWHETRGQEGPSTGFLAAWIALQRVMKSAEPSEDAFRDALKPEVGPVVHWTPVRGGVTCRVPESRGHASADCQVAELWPAPRGPPSPAATPGVRHRELAPAPHGLYEFRSVDEALIGSGPGRPGGSGSSARHAVRRVDADAPVPCSSCPMAAPSPCRHGSTTCSW